MLSHCAFKLQTALLNQPSPKSPLQALAVRQPLSDQVTLTFGAQRKATALMRAAWKSEASIKIVQQLLSDPELLLAHKADPNQRSRNGDTLLMQALQQKKMDIAEKLLEHGADFDLPNKEGQTAWTQAIERKDELALQLLIKAASKRKSLQDGHAVLFALSQKRFWLVGQLLKLPHHLSKEGKLFPPNTWRPQEHPIFPELYSSHSIRWPYARFPFATFQTRKDRQTQQILSPLQTEGVLKESAFLDFFQELAKQLPEDPAYVIWQFPNPPIESRILKDKDGNPLEFPHVHRLKLSTIQKDGESFLLIQYQDNEKMIQDLELQESILLHLESGHYRHERLNVQQGQQPSRYYGEAFFLDDFWRCLTLDNAGVANGGSPKRYGPIIATYDAKDQQVNLQELSKGLHYSQLELLKYLRVALKHWDEDNDSKWMEAAYRVASAFGDPSILKASSCNCSGG